MTIGATDNFANLVVNEIKFHLIELQLLVFQDEYDKDYLLDLIHELENCQVRNGHLIASEFVSLLDLGVILYGELKLLKDLVTHTYNIENLMKDIDKDEELGLQANVNDEIDKYLFSYNTLTLYLNRELFSLFLDWMDTYIKLIEDPKERMEVEKQRRVFRRYALFSDETETYLVEIKRPEILAFLIQLLAVVIICVIKGGNKCLFNIPQKKTITLSTFYSRVRLNGPFLNIKEELRKEIKD